MITITKTNKVLKNSSKLWCKTSSTQQYYYIFTGQNSCDFHTYLQCGNPCQLYISFCG